MEASEKTAMTLNKAAMSRAENDLRDSRDFMSGWGLLFSVS